MTAFVAVRMALRFRKLRIEVTVSGCLCKPICQSLDVGGRRRRRRLFSFFFFFYFFSIFFLFFFIFSEKQTSLQVLLMKQ